MTKRIYEALNELQRQLADRNLDAHAAFLLVEYITQKSRTTLLADMRELFTDVQEEQYNKLSKELLSGKPVQHITGEEWFYGRPFIVSKDVLIPRPETEELVQEALTRIRKLFGAQPVKVADIGTGSGAIAISCKLENPQMNVTATDISQAALTIAKKNADVLGASLDFRIGNLVEPLRGETWDVVLSNPPYISEKDALDMSVTVVQFEPYNALFAEEEGLALYKELAFALPEILEKKALIGLEIGHLQGRAVQNLFQKAFPNAKVEVIQDINGKDRMIFCEIE